MGSSGRKGGRTWRAASGPRQPYGPAQPARTRALITGPGPCLPPLRASSDDPHLWRAQDAFRPKQDQPAAPSRGRVYSARAARAARAQPECLTSRRAAAQQTWAGLYQTALRFLRPAPSGTQPRAETTSPARHPTCTTEECVYVSKRPATSGGLSCGRRI